MFLRENDLKSKALPGNNVGAKRALFVAVEALFCDGAALAEEQVFHTVD